MGRFRSRPIAHRSAAPARRGRVVVFPTVLLVLFGCYGVARPASPARTEMYIHFQAVRDARAAAIHGDLEGLRQSAGTIRDRGAVAGIPADAVSGLFDLRRRARQIEEARTLEEAIRLTPVLVYDCGHCHVTAGVDLGSRFDLRTVPEGEGAERHALRLDWAVSRLWEGLLGPSDGAWSVGVGALPDGRSFGPEIVARVGDADRVMADRDSFDGLARRAEAAASGDDRALVLGEILEACSGCHRSVL